VNLLIIAIRVAAQKYRPELLLWMNDQPPPPKDAQKYWRQDISRGIIDTILASLNQPTITWTKPNIESETEEFKRTADELNLDLDKLIRSAARGFTQELNDDLWSNLQNTDSYGIRSMKEVELLALEYGKDLESIVDAIGKGQSIPSPIILIGNGKPYLIAGNTRLMIARAMGIIPEIFCIDLSTA